MIGPCWVGEVDSGLLGVEFGEEEATQVDSAGSRDGLQCTDLGGGCVSGGCFGKVDAPVLFSWPDTYALFADGWAVRADNQLLCGRGEVGETANGEVFVVETGVVVDGIVGLFAINMGITS